MPGCSKIDRKDLEKKIDLLFPMPQILSKIMDILSNPEGSVTRLEAALKADPAFTVKLLNLANSAYYGLPNRVTNIHIAITLLGFTTIKNLAMQLNISQHYKDQKNIPELSAKDLLKHSVGVAVCAKLLARRLRSQEAEDLFTLGILHDIGHLILLHFFPDALSFVLSRFSGQDKSLPLFEREWLGIDHAEISKMLCDKWRLPRHLGITLACHHTPLDVLKEYRQNAAFLFLADKIVMGAEYGFTYNRDNEQALDVVEMLGLGGLDFESLGNQFQEEGDKLLAIFSQA